MRLNGVKIAQLVTECEESLNRVIAELEGMPEGVINISGSKAKPIIYSADYKEVDGKGRIRTRKTIHDDAMVDVLIRKAYLEKTVKLKREELAILTAALDGMGRIREDTAVLEELLGRLSLLGLERVRHACIKPAGISTEEKLWGEQPYKQSDYKPELKRKRTSRGLMVRSKSEQLIAELLYSYGIPCRYEAELRIGEAVYAPDFTIRRADGKIFYWEHMGLISSIGYYDRQLSKLRVYYGAKIVPWDNLILSFDNDSGDLDVRTVDQLIRQWLVLEL